MDLRAIFESSGVIIAKHFIPVLPRMVVYKLSRISGLLVYIFSPKLRNVAKANIDLAFGDSKTGAEKRRINIGSLQSFILTSLDLFWFNRNTHERLKKYMSYDESFRMLFDEGSAVILTAHLGNWEIMGVGCGDQGYPLTSIAMPLSNPFANKELNILRTKTGCSIAKRKGALRHVLKALKRGHGTALLVDQNTLPEEGGVFVPFFGLPVAVSNVVGAISSVANSKIYASWCIPDKRGCYKSYARKSLDNCSDNMTREEITSFVTRELEGIIRDNPEYWLWSYKRWCFYREGGDMAKYPFYAESYEVYSEYRKLVKTYRAAQESANKALQVLREFERESEEKEGAGG